MAEVSCADCGQRVPDMAYVCSRCSARVSRRLAEAGELWAEVAIAVARIVRFGDRVPLHAGERPIPLDYERSNDADAVVNTATTWARHISGERGQTPPAGIPQLLAWLAGQCDWLRYRPEAAEALDELEDAAVLVVRIIDAPAPRAYLGPCLEGGCREDLYGRPGRDHVTCRACGTVHEAAARREWLLGEASDVLGSPVEVARFVSAYRGELVTAAAVRGLAHRGRIGAHGTDRVGRARYRVGDVLVVIGERVAS